jgi:hypothetical protein
VAPSISMSFLDYGNILKIGSVVSKHSIPIVLVALTKRSWEMP